MLTIIVYSLISAVALFYIAFHFFGNRELYNKISHFPGPKTFPLIGCAYLLIGNGEHALKQLIKFCNSYSSPFRLVLGHRIMVVIQDPEQVKAIATIFLLLTSTGNVKWKKFPFFLKFCQYLWTVHHFFILYFGFFKTLLQSPKTIQKDDVYKFGEKWVGNGLLTSPGPVWRIHRKLLTPAFSPQVLKPFLNIFLKHSQLLIESLEREINGQEFDVFPYMTSTTFNILCESTMGVDVLLEKDMIHEYAEAGESLFESIIKRVCSPWLHPEIFFNLSPTSKIFNDCVKKMHSVTTTIMKRKRKEMQNASAEKTIIFEATPGRKKPLLDILLQLSKDGENFTDQEIREHIDTVLFAGEDTIARVNCFTMLMLASHPNIQDKVYEELFKLYGDEDPADMPVKYEDLQQMEYLERVIKETMRIFPAAPVVGRKMLEDFDIGGYKIPKDCGVLVSIIKLHRDEKIWPDPFKFDPDRFLPEEIEKRHPYSFIPFSSGPRNCIGRQYAMIAMKTLFATILRKYIFKKDTIVPNENIRLKTELLLRPVDPITVKIEKRMK